MRSKARRKPAAERLDEPLIREQPDGSWNVLGAHRRILVRGLKTWAAAKEWVDENG